MPVRAAILVASDRISRGEEQDKSGALAAELLSGFADVVEVRVVPDEVDDLAGALREWAADGVDLVLTIGGTGFSPRDVTPEATRAVLDRETPGIATALLVKGLESTPKAMLSRAVAGICDHTLIVNLPGSRSAVSESIPYLLGILPHALEVIGGTPEPYGD